ncbi:thiamine phosphate synthase [soil metagenome]
MASQQRFDPSMLRLIAITDSLRDGIPGLVSRAEQAVSGGATMLQLRLPDETPRTLVEAARALRASLPHVPLLVNERADVALAASAQGVHVNVDGVSAEALRRIAPPGFIIGASVGDDAECARAVAADYVGIGPVFAAPRSTGSGGALGLERFSEIARRCGIPAVAIGGISAANAGSVIGAGASGVAVISALFSSADPMQAARDLRAALDASGS